MQAELIDAMQDAIAEVSPMAAMLDAVGLRFDEALITFSLTHARGRSWAFAEALAAADLARVAGLLRARGAEVPI